MASVCRRRPTNPSTGRLMAPETPPPCSETPILAADNIVGSSERVAQQLVHEAIRTGRTIRFDPEKEVALGDEEANRMRSRSMRRAPPWKVQLRRSAAAGGDVTSGE